MDRVLVWVVPEADTETKSWGKDLSERRPQEASRGSGGSDTGKGGKALNGVCVMNRLPPWAAGLRPAGDLWATVRLTLLNVILREPPTPVSHWLEVALALIDCKALLPAQVGRGTVCLQVTNGTAVDRSFRMNT